jgi:hypothetical protein
MHGSALFISMVIPWQSLLLINAISTDMPETLEVFAKVRLLFQTVEIIPLRRKTLEEHAGGFFLFFSPGFVSTLAQQVLLLSRRSP